MSQTDYRKVFQLSKDPQRLYKQFVKLHHPDRGGSELEMKAINAAWDEFNNPTPANLFIRPDPASSGFSYAQYAQEATRRRQEASRQAAQRAARERRKNWWLGNERAYEDWCDAGGRFDIRTYVTKPYPVKPSLERLIGHLKMANRYMTENKRYELTRILICRATDVLSALEDEFSEWTYKEVRKKIMRTARRWNRIDS